MQDALDMQQGPYHKKDAFLLKNRDVLHVLFR